MQRVTPDIGPAFQPVEDDLRGGFLPSLFKGATSHILGREVNSLLVNQANIALPDPTHTDRYNWTASCVITGNLLVALHGMDEFWSGGHPPLMVEGRDEILQQHAKAAEKELGDARAAASTDDAHRMVRIMQAEDWLSVFPSTVNGTALGSQEWRYSLFLRYGINPHDLPYHCDGCGAAFDICHTLNCKKGGLITACHNNLRDGVTNLAIKDFTPTHVRDEPKI